MSTTALSAGSDHADRGEPAQSTLPAEPSVTAETLIHQLVRRYGATCRGSVAIGCAVIAPWTDPEAGFVVIASVAAVVVGWNVVYLRQLLRAFALWCVTADLFLVCALCLAQPWLESPDFVSEWGGWIAPLASFTVVALQWQLSRVLAWVATVLVCLAFFLGGVLSGAPLLTMLLFAGWTAVEGALALLLWLLVRRSGMRADDALAREFEQDRQARAAAAQRGDQRRHWASVHDTSATTLLMVGLGQVDGTEPWWHPQLRRDLEALSADIESPDGDVELGAHLVEPVDRSRVDATLHSRAEVLVPAAVAEAFAGATAEALENVRRHAGVPDAEVRVVATGSKVAVTVRDRGCGFDVAGTGDRGHGLEWSVVGRMNDVSGWVGIDSRPGEGTAVRMEWDRDPEP